MKRSTATEYFKQISDENNFFIAKGDFSDEFYLATDEERIGMIKCPAY
jgi:hypothetical protein